MAQGPKTVAEMLAFSPPGWGSALLHGLVISVQVAVGGYAIGLVLGLFGAVGKLYGGPIIKDLVGIYTTLIRAIPELVLIVLLYYAGTDVLNRLFMALGVGSIDVSGLVAGILVIGVVQGAYSTEVLRGAIEAIPRGQIEAARAFGMSSLGVVRRILIPAMLPFAVPGLSNLWLIATKDTALLAVVGFAELTLITRQAAGTTKAYLLFFSVAGVLYLGLTLVSSAALLILERRIRRWMPSLR